MPFKTVRMQLDSTTAYRKMIKISSYLKRPYLISLGNEKIAELLIQKGADVNIAGDSDTALISAADNGKNIYIFAYKSFHFMVNPSTLAPWG